MEPYQTRTAIVFRDKDGRFATAGLSQNLVGVEANQLFTVEGLESELVFFEGIPVEKAFDPLPLFRLQRPQRHGSVSFAKDWAGSDFPARGDRLARELPRFSSS